MLDNPEKVLEEANRIVSEWAEERRDISQAMVRPSMNAFMGSMLEIYMATSATYRGQEYYFTSHVHPSSFFYDTETLDAILESHAQRTYLAFQQEIRSGSLDEKIDRDAETEERRTAEAARVGSGQQLPATERDSRPARERKGTGGRSKADAEVEGS